MIRAALLLGMSGCTLLYGGRLGPAPDGGVDLAFDRDIGIGIDAGGPCPTGAVCFEAEDATLAAPMAAQSDATASQGQFISSSQEGAGTATWTFTIAQAGSYVVWSRVKSPTQSLDSFFTSMDGAAETQYNTVEKPLDAWQWTRIKTPDVSPLVFDLAPGMHQLVFRCREAGTALDRLIVTADMSFQPQ